MATVIILAGKHRNKKAYVTHDDGEHVRVTPVNGDPLESVSLEKHEVEYIDDQPNPTGE